MFSLSHKLMTYDTLTNCRHEASTLAVSRKYNNFESHASTIKLRITRKPRFRTDNHYYNSKQKMTLTKQETVDKTIKSSYML